MSTRTPPSRPQEAKTMRALSDAADTAVAIDTSELDAMRSSQSDVPTVVQDNPLTALPAKEKRLATLPMGMTGMTPGEPSTMRRIPVATDPQETTTEFEASDALRAAATRLATPAIAKKSEADSTTPWGVTPPTPAAQPRVAETRPPPQIEPVAEPGPPLRVVNVTAVLIAAMFAMALAAGAGLLAGVRSVSRAPSAPSTPAPIAPSTKPEPIASVAPSVVPSIAPAPKQEDVPAELLSKESGARPSKQAIDHMIDRVRPALEACASGLPKAFYLVKIDFDGPTGTAVGVESPNKPLKGTPKGRCILDAGLAARVPPFAGTVHTQEIKFAPK